MNQIHSLIELIYDTSYKMQGDWFETIGKINKYFKSHSGGFLHYSTSNPCISSNINLAVGYNKRYCKIYTEQFQSKNPFTAIDRELQSGKIVTERTFDQVYAERDFFYTTDFYNHWCKIQNIDHIAATCIEEEADHKLLFSINRTRKELAYTQNEQNQLLKLAPHLSTAKKIFSKLCQLRSYTTDLERALNHTDLGVLLINKNNEVYYKNQAAKDILRDEIFYFEGLQLKIACSLQKEKFERSIDESFKLKSSSVFQIEKYSKKKLCVCVVPYTESRELLKGVSSSYSTVFLCDFQHRAPGTKEIVKEIWNLSCAEADIVLSITEGKKLRDIAKIRGVSYETVRWHSKNIYKKTGTKTQNELAAIINSIKKFRA